MFNDDIGYMSFDNDSDEFLGGNNVINSSVPDFSNNYNTQPQQPPSMNFNSSYGGGQFGSRNQINGVHVVKLIMIELGGNKPAYRRPYEVDPSSETIDTLDNIIRNKQGKITPGDITNNLSGLLRPRANPTSLIQIPNGWGTSRLGYIAEIELHYTGGSTVCYYIQGYTDYHDPSFSGLISPEMTFVIGSITVVNRVRHPTTGLIVDKIVNSTDVLFKPTPDFGSMPVENMSSQMFNIDKSSEYLVRPVDLIGGIESNILRADINSDGNDVGVMADSRCTLLNTPTLSRKMNNVSGDHAARLLTAWISSTDLTSVGSSVLDRCNQASTILDEGIYNVQGIVKVLANIQRRDSIDTISFTLDNLLDLDGSCKNKIQLVTRNNADPLQVIRSEDSEDWYNTNMETQIATIISNAVPAIMSDLLISTVSLSMTNDTYNGEHIITILDGNSLINDNDTRRFDILKNRLLSLLIPDISRNGYICYTVFLVADMFNNTIINVSINGGPMTPYVAATYASHLTTPVITDNQQMYHGVVGDLETIFGSCSELYNQE